MTDPHFEDSPNEAYEALQKEMREFLYTVSHDFNAPLRHIREFTKLLVGNLEPHLGPKERQYAQIIDSSVKKSEAMIDGLLKLSRLNTRAQAFTECNGDEVVILALGRLARAIDDCNADIRTHPIPTLYGDDAQLELLFHSLIDNALRFRHAGTSPIIEIGAEEKNGMIECYVKDNGIGMEPGFEENVYTLFTTHPNQDEAGYGVGLALVKKVIERHQGSIRYTSEKGKGTTFYFTLPQKSS